MPRLAILILVAAVIAGCGGAARNRGNPPSLAEGAQVFASSCSGCHTLAPGGGPVPSGGPLAGYRMTNSQIESFVRQMPLRRPLSARETAAVVAFVAHAQRARAK